MSHFLTFVLVGREHAADLERKVSEMLDPYFEHSERAVAPKFDGCVIGGRFDGQLFGAEPMYNLTPAEFQARYGLDVVTPDGNVRRASEVPAGFVPYAVVTPDGRWFDREGEASGRRWEARVRALLGEHGDCLAVAVDCHC